MSAGVLGCDAVNLRGALGDLDAGIDDPRADAREAAESLAHHERGRDDAIAGDIDAGGLGIEAENPPLGPVRCVHVFTFPWATDIALADAQKWADSGCLSASLGFWREGAGELSTGREMI